MASFDIGGVGGSASGVKVSSILPVSHSPRAITTKNLHKSLKFFKCQEMWPGKANEKCYNARLLDGI